MILRLRDGLVGVVLGIAVTLAIYLFFRPDHLVGKGISRLPAGTLAEEHATGGHDPGGERSAPQENHAAHTQDQDSVMTGNATFISPERLQSIGVKFEPAARRPLDRLIRTVGRVEVDERLLARVTIKLEGWIDRLFVNYTSESVKRGQVLFTLYSPELVATQEEYLIALRSSRTLGKSEFPEVSAGAKKLLEASRRRLLLWDIDESHILDLERTGQVLTTLPIHAPRSGGP